MIKGDFGATVAQFVETDGISDIESSQICAFRFVGNIVRNITHVIASIDELSLSGYARLLVFEGGPNVNLSAVIRAGLSANLESDFGITVLADRVGITENFEFEFGERLKNSQATTLYVLLTPPYNSTYTALVDAFLSLTVLGFVPKASESDIIYEGYKGR